MPDQGTLLVIAIVIATLLVLLVPVGLFYARALHDVPVGRALVVQRPRETEVFFSPAIVLPVVHKAELVDISVKTIEVDRRGKDGLPCRDGIRADVKATFFVRINRTAEDVRKVVALVGAERASNPATLEELLSAKFSEGLKTVAASLEFEQLYLERDRFKDGVLETIGMDLNGYILDDAAIDVLEQTPIEQLDPDNIRDAEGIRKITEVTSAEKIRTAETRMQAERRLAKLTAEMELAQIELERDVTDALGRFGQQTGQVLTREQLQDKLLERVREVVRAMLDEDENRH